LSVILWFDFGLKAPANSELVPAIPIGSYRRKALQVVRGPEQPSLAQPFHPQVQRFIVGLIALIITKYDVDGIHRRPLWPGVIWGMTPSQLGFTSGKMGASPHNPKNPAWMRWRG